jgi:predicted Zn-dependent protease with MMP-like domain
VTDAQRHRFDEILERVLEDLPEGIFALTEEMPIIVEDQPDQKLLDELSKEAGETILPDELCGLHTGVAYTEKSVTAPADLPSSVHLFRVGILAEAGGWEGPGEDTAEVEEAVYEEIRITLLHEIGHQFGLDEDDLERLGYQ